MRALLIGGLVLLGCVPVGGAVMWQRAGAEAERLLQLEGSFDPQAPRAELDRALVGIRESLAGEAAQLAPLAPLFEAGTRSDAGPLLNALVEWRLPWPDRPRPALSLPRAVVEKLAAWGEGDVKRLAEIDLEHVDLGWMGQLQQFDHWDLERNSPLASRPAADLAGSPELDEDPLLEELTPWVKLRLMKGLADGDPWPALAETRQLERLLVSTQTLLGTIEALVLLRLERQAWVAAIASRPDRPDLVDRWPGIGDAELPGRAITWLRALPVLLGPEAVRQDFDRAMRTRAPGLCAALREATRTAVVLSPLLADARADRYRRLDEAAAALPDCRLDRLRRGLGAPSLSTRWSAFGRLGEDARPLAPGSAYAPLLLRLAFLRSSRLREAAGERILLDASTAALVAAASGR